jgi:chromosome segregation ATPase
MKTIKEITARIEELKAEKTTRENKWRKEISDAREKAASIDEKLQTAEDPDEYKKLLREKTENDQFLDFLNTKNKQLPPAITRDEYNVYHGQLLDELEELQEEYAPKVEKAARELVLILNEYSEKACGIEDTRAKLSDLHLNHGNIVYKVNELTEKITDPMYYTQHFCREFFAHNSEVKRLARALTTGATRSVWYNPEQAAIYKELERRMKR